MSDLIQAIAEAARYWTRYKRCPMCGAEPGEPCTVIRRHPSRVTRTEPHFYREQQWD